MKWSYGIGSVAGIRVQVHATFFLLLLWIAASEWMSGGGPLGAALGALFSLTVFGVVVLHELGHALTARRFGIRTRDITLLPIGGVARLERMPEKPGQEFLVAIAGPAVNVALASVLAIIVRPSVESLEIAQGLGGFDALAARLFWVNVFMAGFNLVPAFPMDGGRVLRALLAMRLPMPRATRIAARIGQTLAIGLAILGIWGNMLLVLIAVFVALGAQEELRSVELRAKLQALRARDVMRSDFTALDVHDSLGAAAQLSVSGLQHDFPVTDRGRLVGMLSRNEIAATLPVRGAFVPVGQLMRTDFDVVDADGSLGDELAKFQRAQLPALPVVHGDSVVGLLTTDAIELALRAPGGRS